MAKLKSESSREDLGQVCKSFDATKLLHIHDDQQLVCKEYVSIPERASTTSSS